MQADVLHNCFINDKGMLKLSLIIIIYNVFVIFLGRAGSNIEGDLKVISLCFTVC